MAALLGETILFVPGYECTIPQLRQAILTAFMSGYRLVRTSLLRDPYCIQYLRLPGYPGHRCFTLFISRTG